MVTLDVAPVSIPMGVPPRDHVGNPSTRSAPRERLTSEVPPAIAAETAGGFAPSELTHQGAVESSP